MLKNYYIVMLFENLELSIMGCSNERVFVCDACGDWGRSFDVRDQRRDRGRWSLLSMLLLLLLLLLCVPQICGCGFVGR